MIHCTATRPVLYRARRVAYHRVESCRAHSPQMPCNSKPPPQSYPLSENTAAQLISVRSNLFFAGHTRGEHTWSRPVWSRQGVYSDDERVHVMLLAISRAMTPLRSAPTDLLLVATISCFLECPYAFRLCQLSCDSGKRRLSSSTLYQVCIVRGLRSVRVWSSPAIAMCHRDVGKRVRSLWETVRAEME